MIQEIAPHRYDNHYEPLSPSPDDRVFLFSPPKMLAREGEGREIRFPRLKDFARLPGELIYLFSIDGEKFFLAQPDGEWEAPGFSLLHTGAIRGCTPPELSFAAATAMQLSRWYRDNRFCGRCGGEMARDTKERMLYCPCCKNTVYPKISPCIITGITDGDRILLTKYARSGYNHYALVAGFCEIGESFEETLRREVAEEVGLEVENIRYWNSQPWSFSDSLLAGFFCDVRGSRTPRLVDGELKEASWFSREEIPVSDDGVSLTRAMIEAFRQGKA
ncbi:MAG TPA: NAD(+) diphosphatase [Candidatus Faecivivens stercoravium]|uniref:NAD(+) diphosphatase n=1 Tax=Candidatus Faecivivens stercoravium TaxID=2840803 RepID=A0A9D1DZG0_9FIRM|nr:NAD(+) diphosphatase [Candidatus Faecivivens stercoravium]